LLLLFAVTCAVAAAAWQDRQVQKSWRDRESGSAMTMAARISALVAREATAQERKITAAREDFADKKYARLVTLLESTIEQDQYVGKRAVLVTNPDGSIAFAREVGDGVLARSGVMGDITATARNASGTGRTTVSGLLEIAGAPAYAIATPLASVSNELGAWVTVRDVSTSSLGALLDIEPAGGDQIRSLLVDDRGNPIGGAEDEVDSAGDSNVAARANVDGTGWEVLVARTDAPALVPGWVLALLALAVAALTAVWWVQEGRRRTLQAQAEQRERQIRSLYELASELLHSGSVSEQQGRLAWAAFQVIGLDAARVRIAADGDFVGRVAGDVPRNAREYRLAISGPDKPVGELICYRRARPLDISERAAARAMATLAGAAMHTFSVLERERAAGAELQRLDELRSNLLSTVAHELRSPLTAVKGVLGLLAMQDDLTEQQREYLDVARQRTDALVDLIRDLFDCSLMDTGQLDITPERHRATDLLERALGALVASRPEEIYINATPNLLITVDPLRFDQIVNNLVTNAERHGKPPVEVLLRPAPGGAQLLVTDSGPGIAPDERARIFSKFYQSDSGNARLVEGAGLGLALVHGLIKLHGGTIDVDNARLDGTGARFRLFFPDVVPDPSTLATEDDDLVTGGDSLLPTASG
jgi:signal transduction histidine kinase